jgi:UDP-N-acetylmuramoylalanine--D-glutamate ligase
VRPPLPGGPYLVVGLARSGQAAAALLAGRGERVAGCDSATPDGAAGLSRAGVEVHLDTDGTQLLLAERPPRTVVKSPGVPQEAPVLERARELGIDVVGELEIGWRLVPGDFCAVTGTNGKTTTTELLGEIYRRAGMPVAVAGNVGAPVSSFAGELGTDTTVVCEASSFQLEDAVAFAPEVGVFLNFAEDHLDRHGSVEAYLAAKLSLFERQGENDIAVLNSEQPVDPGGAAHRVWFGTDDRSTLRLADGWLLWHGEPFMEAGDVGLRGPHNLRNAMAAAAATLASGIDAEAAYDALREFGGVRHRLEDVAEIDGVLYVNDSKATNPAAAEAALRSFEGGVHAIMGGSLKGGGFGELVPAVNETCVRCYLIGEAADRLAADLGPSGVELVQCGDLERAVAEASRAARAGEVVLLVPACASFDQYRDFEERGEHFIHLVRALSVHHSAEGSSP